MAGISSELQMVLYGLLVVILGVAGYYIGSMMSLSRPMLGAGIGVVGGVIIVGLMMKFVGGGGTGESTMEQY